MSRQCRVIMLDERCTEPGIYVVYFGDCASCRETLGALLCTGHSTCLSHTASARAGGALFDHIDGRGPAIPVRVHDA